MGFDSFGVKRGLAYRHNYEKSMDNAFRLSELHDRKITERKQDAARLAEAFKTPYTNTNYNRKREDAVVEGAIQKFQKFQEENPFWETDPKLYMEFNKIRDEILNNPVMAEELEAQKQFQIMAADEESSLEHKQKYLDAYNAYANQDFQTTGLDPNGNIVKNDPYKSATPAFVYKKEDTWSIYNTLDDISKTVLNPQYLSDLDVNVDKDGNNIVTRGFTNEKYDAAMLAIQGDQKYKRSLSKAFKQYYEGEISAEKDPLYKNEIEYGNALLRGTFSNIKDFRGQNQAHIEKIRQQGDTAALMAVPIYTLKMVDQLLTNGSVSVGSNGLVFSAFKQKGGSADVTNSGAMFTVRDKDSKSDSIDQGMFPDYFKNAKAVSGGNLIYEPNTGNVMMEVRVVISDDLQNIEELDKRGFTDFKQYSDASLQAMGLTPEEIRLFKDNERAYQRIGTILVPVNLTDPMSYHMFEASVGGKAQNAQYARSLRETEVMNYTKNALNSLKERGKTDVKANAAGFVRTSGYIETKQNYDENINKITQFFNPTNSAKPK